MFYREAGQYKTTYAADHGGCSRSGRIASALAVILLVAFVVAAARLPANFVCSSAVMIPLLVFALAAIGLNILTGYTGRLSLGTGGFMGVGAYACCKLTTIFPEREHHRP